MIRVRFVLPSLLAAASWCADAPSPTSPAAAPIELRLADGATLVADWNASLYGKLFADPAFAQVKQALDAAMAKAQEVKGIDPWETLRAMTGLRVLITDFEKAESDGDNPGKPRIHMLATGDFGALAAKLMQGKPDNAVAAQIAGADEAMTFEKPTDNQTVTVARYGTALSLGVNCAPVKPGPAKAPPADLQAIVDIAGLVALIAKAMPDDQADTFTAMTKDSDLYSGTYDYRASLVPEGLLERFTQTRAWPHLIPVDRDLVGRLPATTLIELALGTDGKALWKTGRPTWLAQAAAQMTKTRGTPVTPDEAEQEINGNISAAGLDCTLQDLIEGFNGTTLFALGQGVPFPSFTLAIPRSPAFDRVVAKGLQLVQAEPPAEGTSTMLPIPNLPMAVNLICDKDHWVVTSDPTITANWTGGAPGGWADSPAGKLALEKAPANAVMLGSSDTPAVLRTLNGYINMALGLQQGMDGKQKQAVLQALAKLGTSASSGYLFTTRSDRGTVVESRGLLGFGGLPIVLGAIGFAFNSKAAEATIAGDPEVQAVSELKTTILPAEVKFQAALYLDQDGNGVGEYGLLSELGGARTVAGAPALSLVGPDLAAGSANGYHFAVYLPDADGAMLQESDDISEARTKDEKAASLQEHHWVAYAWPEDDHGGKRMFAITPDGVVRQALFLGDPPVWSDVFGGAGWDAKPAWDTYRK